MFELLLTTATLSPSAGLSLSPPPQAPVIEQVPSYACDCKGGCQCSIPGGPYQYYICPKSYGQSCPVSGEVYHQPTLPQAPTTRQVRVQQCFLDNNGVQRCRMVEMEVPVDPWARPDGYKSGSSTLLTSSQNCTTCGQSVTSGFYQNYSYSSSSYSSSSNGGRRWWPGKHLGRQMPARLQARQGNDGCQ